MKTANGLFCFLLAVTVFFIGCEKTENLTSDQIQIIESPAGPQSGEPNLFSSAEGTIYMSWVEAVETGGHRLRFSVFEKNRWAESKTIARGDNWFVNWADFPSLVALDQSCLAAHWLAKSGEATFAYDVNISFSKDEGTSWSTPITPHRDGTQTEHGFVSLLPWDKNRLFALWLDGRNFAGDSGSDGHGSTTNEMTLRFAEINQDGNLFNEQELDSRVCECCQTSAAVLPDGAIVAYRDRSREEIRDIYILRMDSGKWSKPQVLYQDGWKIAGCPVSGPAVDSSGDRVSIAWFTAANDTQRVQVMFSGDGGKTFGQPVQIDDGNPIGRVDVVVLPDGSSLICWLERKKETTEIKIRKVRTNGQKEQSVTITQTSSGRASGFPRMVCNSENIIFAWTQIGEKTLVQTAKIRVADLE